MGNLNPPQIDEEGENCTTFMTIQGEGENAKAHDVRCIPAFLPCDCKNETWRIAFADKYPLCEVNVEVPYAYLCVHKYETCMEAFEYSSPDEYFIEWCMPDEKRDECEDETWEELSKYNEENNYGFYNPNCTKTMYKMNDSSETDESVEIELSDATGPIVI